MSVSLNPSISKFDEEFDAEKSSQYRLTIQLALDGLSYVLLDTKNKRIIALECYPSDPLSDSDDFIHTMERSLETKGLNNKAFHSVTCIIDERTNILVPNELFNEDDKEQYLGFAFTLLPGFAILYDTLKTHKVINVFGMAEALRTKILARWPMARITHSTSVFLETLPQTEKPMVYVNVRKHDFDMAVMKDKLLFFNNYKFNVKDDFAYFLLFAMEQNNLAGNDTPVVFSGLIQPDSEIIDLCKRYVKDIVFVENPQQVCKALEKVPFQYYYNHYQTLRQETSRHETRDV